MGPPGVGNQSLTSPSQTGSRPGATPPAPTVHPMEPQASPPIQGGPPTTLRLPHHPGGWGGKPESMHTHPRPPPPIWGLQSPSAIQHEPLSREVIDWMWPNARKRKAILRRRQMTCLGWGWGWGGSPAHSVRLHSSASDLPQNVNTGPRSCQEMSAPGGGDRTGPVLPMSASPVLNPHLKHALAS